MAEAAPNMPFRVAEAHASTSTPLTRQFSSLLAALDALIEAEQDLDGSDPWDPALHHWLRDAELAEERVTKLTCAILGTEVCRIEDVPLRRFALLLDGIMGSEDARDFFHYRRILDQHSAFFDCTGSTPAARHTRALLRAGRERLWSVVTLPAYRDPPEEDPVDPLRAEAPLALPA